MIWGRKFDHKPPILIDEANKTRF